MDDLFRILVVLSLVGANAFFVIGEYAVVTARRSALAPKAESGHRGARAALRLMDDPVRVISTVQVGITAIGILTGALGEPLVRELLGGAIPAWISFVIAFGVVTYLSVVLGELVPKALTLQRAETLAALVARPVELISIVFRPLVWVLQGSAQLLLRPFGVQDVVAGDTVRSPEELRALVDEAEESGVIPRAEEELLHNVFGFAGLEARDVMKLASEVAWLDASESVGNALKQVVTHTHTRYPVGRGSLDRLAGIVHVRELVAAAQSDPERPVESVAVPALFVPQTKDLGALLRELRETRQQLAVVGDEYGRTVGIVALEDIVEEIVGEIEGEYDLPDDTLVWESDGRVVVAGSMTIDDFNETVKTELPRDGARTMAGLVYTALGRRPNVGDFIAVGSVRLSVEELEDLRIKRLRVEVRPPSAPGAAPVEPSGPPASRAKPSI